LYDFLGNEPIGRWDLLGLDFIAITSSRVVRGIGHYAVEYWRACPMPIRKYSLRDFLLEHRRLWPHAHQPRQIDSVELIGTFGWGAIIRCQITGVFRPQHVWVSFIQYELAKGTHLVPLFQGPRDSPTVRAKWDVVLLNAGRYRFAEQAPRGVQARPHASTSPPFRFWPNSRYFIPPAIFHPRIENNSNVFVRWLVDTSGIGMVEIRARWHPPRLNSPVPVPAADYRGVPWRWRILP